jgi:hypothetical protein
MKRYVVMFSVMALLMVALAVPAFADPQLPLPGQVERGTEHANSICSFSGLNDVPLDLEEGGLVQSYGQIVAAGFLDPTDQTSDERPGVLCNAHTHPYPEAFPPPAP